MMHGGVALHLEQTFDPHCSGDRRPRQIIAHQIDDHQVFGPVLGAGDQFGGQVGVAEVLEATFPPGSITGAPKHQAMKVIAGHERPRGPWCGSLFGLGLAGGLAGDGALTASVLIRTASFDQDGSGWRWRALAGAGIVADSDPRAEREETEAKIRALKEALVGP